MFQWTRVLRRMYHATTERIELRLVSIDWWLLVVKLRRALRIWFLTTIRKSFAPIFGGSEFLQLLVLPIFLWLVFLWRGFSEMSAEFTIWWAGKQALIWALPFWILANAVFAAFQFGRIQRSSGEWVGRRFVYNEPVLAFSRLAFPSENNKLFKFHFKDAEPGCLISYKFEVDAPPSWVSLVVMAHPKQWPEFTSHQDHRYGGGTTSVNKKRELYFRYFIPENASPFQIRIYVTGWELQDAERYD